MYDDDSLDYIYYISDVFDTNTQIWWHRDAENITKISDLPEGVYTRESHPKKRDVRLKRIIRCGLYQNKPYDKIQHSSFLRILQHVQNQSYEESN